VLKGDNNHWIDSYRPRETDIIGKLWIRIPSAGFILQRLQTLQTVITLTLTIGLIILHRCSGRKRRGATAQVPAEAWNGIDCSPRQLHHGGRDSGISRSWSIGD
jgi:hypothetical protein